MEEYRTLMGRLNLASRSVQETFETLPEDEQRAWATFFTLFGRDVMEMSDEEVKRFGGCLAQLWALAHEYHRLFGPLWK